MPPAPRRMASKSPVEIFDQCARIKVSIGDLLLIVAANFGGCPSWRL
jgi:hypothetical protein